MVERMARRVMYDVIWDVGDTVFTVFLCGLGWVSRLSGICMGTIRKKEEKGKKMISYFLELSWHLDRIKIRRYGWRRRVVEEGAASIARPRGQQQLPNKEEAKRHRTNRSVIKNVSTMKQPRATWKSFIPLNNEQ